MGMAATRTPDRKQLTEIKPKAELDAAILIVVSLLNHVSQVFLRFTAFLHHHNCSIWKSFAKSP